MMCDVLLVGWSQNVKHEGCALPRGESREQVVGGLLEPTAVTLGCSGHMFGGEPLYLKDRRMELGVVSMC